MFKVSVPASKVAAVALFAPKADIRYYLSGVCFEALQGETRIIATDGSAAAVARIMADNAENNSVVVPVDKIELILKTKPSTIEIVFTGEAWTINGLPFTPCEGKFPAYRRIMPSQVSGDAANFNPEYMMRCLKAGKLLKLKKAVPIVHQNGNDAAVVRFNQDQNFIMVVMPWRGIAQDEIDNGMPTWGNK